MVALIEDFIEMGVDALTPVQVSAVGMDPVRLKRDFGDRIAFWGGIDTQRVLCRGTADDVRREVRERIWCVRARRRICVVRRAQYSA